MPSFIRVGDAVRIYYEDESFDEGEVTLVEGDIVVVDFYDWIERWHYSTFRLRDLFHEGFEVLVPIQRGEVVVEFWRLPKRET